MFIYKTTNLINNKIYIGRYSGKRKSYLGSGKLIKKAIKKYGKENFYREVLEDNIEDNDILNQREIYWIEFYNSTNPKIGYNITIGGDGTTGFQMSNEAKQKLSKINTGENNPNFKVPRTEDVKRKISESQLGEKNHNFGKVTPDKVREKISKSNTGKTHTEETKKILSEKNSGEKNPNFGKVTTEETRKKISLSNIGKFVSDETKEKMSISSSGSSNAMYGAKQSKKAIDIMSEKHIGKKILENTSSKYVGVYLYKRTKKWIARITKMGKTYSLGCFDNEIDAAVAYNKKAIELGVPTERLNSINE